MKSNQLLKIILVILLMAFSLGFATPWPVSGQSADQPQDETATTANVGTAFTYQGQLTDSGSPANGSYDFRFRLYDAVSGGVQSGGTVNVGNVAISDGLFTVEIDFGSVFDGTALWLEVAVRPGSSTGSYTALNPRQALTAAPYALALPGLHTEQNATSPNIIGGFAQNYVANGIVGSTVVGGGRATGLNGITSGNYSFLGGGNENSIGGPFAFLGGGTGNQANGNGSVLVGGAFNGASGIYSTISGGNSNTVEGWYGVVPGGFSNDATGFTSFAAGYRANAVAEGCFVWADFTTADFTCNTNNAFLVRAHGGVKITTESGEQTPGGQLQVETDSTLDWPNLLLSELSAADFARLRFAGGSNPTTHYWDIAGKQGILNFYYRGDFQDVMSLLPDDATNLLTMRNGARLTNGGAWTNASDVHVKTAFDPVNAFAILESVANLPIQSWQYKAEQDQVRHLGPTAQDFYTAFGLGDSETSITTVDADGVALTAIQALYQQNRNLEERLAVLEASQSDAPKTPLPGWLPFLGLGLLILGFIIGWTRPHPFWGRRTV